MIVVVGNYSLPASSENCPLLNRGKHFCGLIQDAHQHEYCNLLQLPLSSVSLNLAADIIWRYECLEPVRSTQASAVTFITQFLAMLLKLLLVSGAGTDSV